MAGNRGVMGMVPPQEPVLPLLASPRGPGAGSASCPNPTGLQLLAALPKPCPSLSRRVPLPSLSHPQVLSFRTRCSERFQP